MGRDLANHPEVYAEAEQVSMRLKGDERGYEKVKSMFEKGKFAPSIKRAESYLGAAPQMALECPRVVARLLRSRA